VPKVSNELIYEIMKKLQEQMSLVREDMRGVGEELSGVRRHMAAMQRDVHNVDDRLDRLAGRLSIQ
jgi:hypothetical protein